MLVICESEAELYSARDYRLFNPLLFNRGLSCPHSVQTSLTQNFLKLTIPGFPYTLLLVFVVTLTFK
jgi:hypothetical protein